ncbi:MAG: hypothetical protein U1A27_06725 [Phycisphaerae bacterium]
MSAVPPADLVALPETHSLLARRIRTAAALAVPALIFWHVGFWAAEPADPFGPISLLLVPNRFLTMVEMFALALVAAALAVAINGPRSAHYGPLGVAVGLAALAWRTGSMDLLPLALAPGADAWPAKSLVFELWLWLGLIAFGAVPGRWVESWHGYGPAAPSADWRRVDTDGLVDSASELARAGVAIAVVAVVAYLLLSVFAGTDRETVLKGQVFFACGASFYVATVVGLSMVRLRASLWLYVSVAIVGALIYILAAPHAQRLGAHLVIPGPARALPIEFAALSAVGITLGAGTAANLRAAEKSAPRAR